LSCTTVLLSDDAIIVSLAKIVVSAYILSLQYAAETLSDLLTALHCYEGILLDMDTTITYPIVGSPLRLMCHSESRMHVPLDIEAKSIGSATEL